MDAKISSATWNDPDLDDFTPEMVLTLFWMKTNPDRNDCGAYRFSAPRFQFETKGLDPSWHDKTRLALGELMMCEGHWFLYVPFIRECLWFGVGKKAAADLKAKALTKPFEALPKPFREKLLYEYPHFRPLWLQEAESQHDTTGNDGVGAADSEGLGKGLPSPYQAQEKRREDNGSQDQRRSGSGESEGGAEGLAKGLPRACQGLAKGFAGGAVESDGGGAEVPDTETVLKFAREWKDLARGMSVIPEGYTLLWLAFRCSPKAGPFPKDWRKDLTLRYVGDVMGGKTTRPSAGSPSQRRMLETQLKNAANPEEKAALREDLRKLGEAAA